jgi:hypothetical protein
MISLPALAALPYNSQANHFLLNATSAKLLRLIAALPANLPAINGISLSLNHFLSWKLTQRNLLNCPVRPSQVATRSTRASLMMTIPTMALTGVSIRAMRRLLIQSNNALLGCGDMVIRFNISHPLHGWVGFFLCRSILGICETDPFCVSSSK